MNAPAKWRGVLTLSAVIIFGVALMRVDSAAPPRAVGGAVTLWMAFGCVIVVERALYSPFDSTLPWWFPVSYGGTIVTFLFGLNFGSNPNQWRALLVLFSWFLSGSSLLYAFGPATDPDGSTPISTFSVGYPMAAIATLGLAFFSSELFAAARIHLPALLGFACCALGVFGRIHKPMVAAGSATLFVVIALQARRMKALRVLRHVAIVFLISAASVTAIDVATSGRLSDSATQIFVERYLHLPPDTKLSEVVEISMDDAIGRVSGGRFNIWAETWERVQASPFVGSGFMQVSQMMGEPVPWHSVFLEMPIAVGTVGVSIIVAGVAWWLSLSRRAVPRIREAAPRSAAVGFLAGIGVLYNVSTGLVFMTLTYLVAFVLGAFVAPEARRSGVALSMRSGAAVERPAIVDKDA